MRRVQDRLKSVGWLTGGRIGLTLAVIVLAVGLVAPIASAHSAISGSGLDNDGSWTHYTTQRFTEAADQGIRVDDLPGRPMNIYIRNGNDVKLGSERRYTTDGQWGWFTTNWDLSLGTEFYVSAKKDQDYYWGATSWSGVIHW